MNALPQGVRLGISPLSWSNDVLEDLGSDISVEACLDDAAQAVFDGIELGRKFPREAGPLSDLLRPRNLSLASGWYSGELAERGLDAEIHAVRKHASLLQKMGCSVLVYGEVAMMTGNAPLDVGMSTRTLMPRADLPAYALRLTEFAIHLRDTYGLRLAYHHHLMMVAETFAEVQALMSLTGPQVGLLLDTGHAAGAGFDYEQLIEHFADRIVHIHLKDVRADVMTQVRANDLSFNDGVRAGMFTVPGDGCLDFAPLARFVRDSGYQGWLVIEAEQDPAKAPPLPAVTRGRDNILSAFQSL